MSLPEAPSALRKKAPRHALAARWPHEGYLSHPFARDKKCDTGRAVQLLVIFRSMNDFSHAPSAKPIRGAVEVRSYFGN
jgi:hypothetical protein